MVTKICALQGQVYVVVVLQINEHRRSEKLSNYLYVHTFYVHN